MVQVRGGRTVNPGRGIYVGSNLALVRAEVQNPRSGENLEAESGRL